ncbi:MAG: RHS repeat protein, partial [Acidobacteria bacterium]|nr:RHS repeat protein [Acidobacteriota bacterium]
SDPEYDLLTQNRWTKVVLLTPDGAEHELRPTDYYAYSDTYGNHPYLRGYYKDNPGSGSEDAPMRYYSWDGSRLWVRIEDDQPLFSGLVGSWTLLLPDGAKVEQLSSGIQRITDSNGNKIKIWSATDGYGVTTTHYQDELTSREIRYVYDPAGNGGLGLGVVEYQTVGGDWVTIDINFGATQVQGKIYWINDAQCTDAAEVVNQELTVIRSIVLPLTETGLSRREFTFAYNSDATDSINEQWRPDCNTSPLSVSTASHGWGSLSRMTTPLGAIVDYSYSFDGDHVYTDPNDPPRESLTLKQLKRIESSAEVTLGEWEYAIGPTSGTVTGPDGSTVIETKYPHDPAFLNSYSGFGGKEGLVYRIDNSGKVRIERQWALMTFSGGENIAPGANTQVTFNPVVAAEYTTLMEGGSPIKMSAKTFDYDYNGNLLEEKSYDWFDPALVSRDAQNVPTGVPGAAVLLRTTTGGFYNQATASNSGNVYAKRSLSTFAPLILNAAEQSITGASQMRYSYDGQSYGAAPSVGNVTKVSVWHDQGSQWFDVTHTYDGYGNRLTTTDPRSYVAQYFYEDSTHANLTKVIVNPGSTQATEQITTMSYDFSTGLMLTQTDVNGQVTTIDYTNHRLSDVDPYGRPGWVTGPEVDSVVGGTTYTDQNHKVKTTYYDEDRQVVVEADLNQEGDGKLKTRTTSDELGRVIKTESNEDGTGSYTIWSESVYIEMGRITMSSNPRRSAGAGADGWTRTTRDQLGRVTEAATFLGTSQPPDTGTNSNWTGSVTSGYNANQTTVTDQAGKQRRSVTDGLGRLSQAIEDPNGLNHQTGYTYDSLGNLRRVEQGTQNRYFMYDSLSRLIRARNPEQDVNTNFNLSDPVTSNGSWTMKYTYDASGNPATRVDARNITTTYGYDGLNRNTSVDYSDSTPDVTRVYDTATLGKGRLQKTETSGGNGVRVTINGYDGMGRPLSQSQQFYISSAWGSSYTVEHKYNLAGNVTGQTYPSGRTTTTSYDAAGRLNTFSGNLGDGTSRNYVTGTTLYTATGQMTQEQYGTTTSLYHRRHFNSRGQMYDVRLGTGATDDFSNSTWNRGAIRTFYSSNLVDYNTPATGQQNNNGNVYRQDHFAPLDTSVNDWVMSVDSYGYDALNRLTGVSEVAASFISSSYQETSPYAQYYNYDRYGNRTLSFATTGATFITDTVWVEDALPAGATGYGDGGDGWTWISSDPAPVSGSMAHQSNTASGLHQHYFTGATSTMAVGSGDRLFAYVYLDP